MSPALQATLLRAREYASGQSHRDVSLEHLLLALSEDEDASAVMSSCQVELNRLRNDVAGYLGSLPDHVPPGQQPAISPALTQILKYATLAAKQGRRPRIDGAIVLAAIVGDGKSMAASFLKAQGLTFEQAVRVLQQAIREGTARGVAAPPTRTALPAPAPERPSPPVAAPEPRTTPVTRPPDAEDILAAARARLEQRMPARPPPELEPEPEDLAPLPTVMEAPTRHEEPPALEIPPYQPVHDAAPPLPAHEAYTPPLPDPAPEPAAWPVADHGPPPAPAVPPQEPAPAPVNGTAPPQPGSWAPNPTAQPTSPPGLAPVRPPLPPLMPLGSTAGRPPVAPPPAASPQSFQAAPPQAAPAPWGPPPERRPPPQQTIPIPPPQQRTGPPSQPLPPMGEPYATGPAMPRTPAIEPAQLSHTIPSRLTVGRLRTVEVHIKRQPLNNGGGASRPNPQRGDIVTARAISVRLRPAKGRFLIDQPSTETQWDKAADGSRLLGEAAVWRFAVEPQTMGKGELLLTVSARTIGADGMIVETALPDAVIPVVAGRDWMQTLRTIGVIGGAVLGALVVKELIAGLTGIDPFKAIRSLLGR